MALVWWIKQMEFEQQSKIKIEQNQTHKIYDSAPIIDYNKTMEQNTTQVKPKQIDLYSVKLTKAQKEKVISTLFPILYIKSSSKLFEYIQYSDKKIDLTLKEIVVKPKSAFKIEDINIDDPYWHDDTNQYQQENNLADMSMYDKYKQFYAPPKKLEDFGSLKEMTYKFNLEFKYSDKDIKLHSTGVGVE